jgi:hypothetical protein
MSFMRSSFRVRPALGPAHVKAPRGGGALPQVTVDAEVIFEGFIHKADFAADGTGLEVYNSNWNRHYLQAGATHTVRLTFDASINTHTGQIELAFDNGLSRTDSSDPSPGSN